MLNFIVCEVHLAFTPFCYTTILKYEIQLTPYGKKSGLDLLDDAYLTAPYIMDSISNSPTSHQLSTQTNKNVWLILINIEQKITYQVPLDEDHIHKD